jgi:hypothetical protein
MLFAMSSIPYISTLSSKLINISFALLTIIVKHLLRGHIGTTTKWSFKTGDFLIEAQFT